jgi:glyoxalase family protein
MSAAQGRPRPTAALGEALSLPPFLEARRAAIEAGLKPLD